MTEDESHQKEEDPAVSSSAVACALLQPLLVGVHGLTCSFMLLINHRRPFLHQIVGCFRHQHIAVFP